MYAERRRQLLGQLENAVALFFAPREGIRNYDVHHDFRQSSDLFYLTGFEEPEVALVLTNIKGAAPRSILFLRTRDIEREIWDGPRLGIDRALSDLKVDEAYPIEELSTRLPKLLLGAEKLYYDLGRADREYNDALVMEAFVSAKRRRRRAVIAPDGVEDSSPLLHEMRLRKSPEEIAIMREAARLTAVGHTRAMEVAKPGVREYQVEAAMEFEWRVRGAERNAYPSIVGSGPNACILHYRAGERVLEDGELVLVDAGCEKGYYASDVTRTWPVSGQFTTAQRQIYAIVLDAQKQAIDACRPGATMVTVHETATRVLVAGLLELGLLEGTVESVMEDESYKRFYMHQTSHWIGMDVHDAGSYMVDGEPRPFEPGMVLTVEPGLYINGDDQEIPEVFRGIGIRIEDDILITDGAPENLTYETPKEIDEVEAIVGSRPLEL